MSSVSRVWFRVCLWLGVVLFLVLFLATGVKAHEVEELDTWVESWVARSQVAVTPELLAEYEDMKTRHLWYFVPQDAPEPHNRPARAQSLSGATPVATPGGVEAWRYLVAGYFPAEAVDTMLCLMAHESGGDPGATNPRTGAAGLFQIMPFWWDHYGGDRYDPETNTRVARAIYDQQGFGAWSPWNRGECR